MYECGYFGESAFRVIDVGENSYETHFLLSFFSPFD